jgi:two-component system, cell cycle sensor histidine kinase and response regulator CckA
MDMGSSTVLLLDDDATMLLVLRTILEARDIQVLESADERTAVGHCQQLPGKIDLLVADVVLRYTDGPAVVRRVKYLQPAMRLLFISGFGLDELGRRGLLDDQDMAPGIVEFLQKPFAAKTFLQSVDGLLSSCAGASSS